MKPYYLDGSVTIYHGDCRELLAATPTADLMLTDPPYGINLNTDNSRFSGGTRENMAKRGNGQGNNIRIANDASDFDPSPLLAKARNHVIWGWNNYANKLPNGACLVWIKRNDAAFGSFLSDAELAWMSKGHGVYCRRDLSNNSITRTRSHPTQKPVSLMAWCLSFFPNCQHVIDPYMGSGTTLRAAKDLGRSAIGIEINERYCEIAAERCRQETLELVAP